MRTSFSQFCAMLLDRGQTRIYPVDESKRGPRTIVLQSNVPLHLEAGLSNGRVATVSRVVASEAGDPNRVAKVLRDPKYLKDMQAELDLYSKYKTQLSGRVVPILESHVDIDGNLILIKPEVVGPNLNKHLLNNYLNLAQLEALHEVLAWTKEFEGETGLKIDINPFNLVWVEDPATMRQLQMSKPGFAFYEFSVGGSGVTNDLYRSFYMQLEPVEPRKVSSGS